MDRKGAGEPSSNSNFKVVIRVRPPLPREIEGEKHYQNIVKVDSNNRAIAISEAALDENGDITASPYATHTFTFDYVFDQNSNQRTVYETCAKPAVVSTLEGYNASIIAYGQTGTGKTYTMEGDQSHRGRNDEGRGIIPRSIEEIFRYISNCNNPRVRFLVRASYLQIYNEVISDLLKPDRANLQIREDRKKGVFVEGLSEWVVRTPGEIYGLMETGAAMRATAATRMNEISSRSHAVFIIIAEQSESSYDEPQEDGDLDGSGSEKGSATDMSRTSERRAKQSFKVGKLNLVDLAGSERVRLTGATGKRLEESKKINQSLSALGNVIAALTDVKGRSHIPYRDSKLTRILEDSLGGNCKTTMMAMISPALEAFVESLSTLKFANRAKNIKNEARVNEDLDQKALLRKYERELKRLRAELAARNKTVVDKRKVLELEEQKRRAEEDKLAAMTALEARSREFIQEKEEKRRLEQKIQDMQSQLLKGGPPIQDSPAFRSALLQEHVRMHSEYEQKLQELEKERQSIENDKAQVDRYKQLLLKQRDIMIALTSRLNERDESILALQEELESADRHQRAMEDALDQKTASLIHLQKLAIEQHHFPAHHLDQTMPQTPVLGPGSASGSWSPASPTTHSEARYRAYGEQVLFDSSGDAAPIATPRLLTADEKIAELTVVLEQKKAEQHSLRQELEDVQAEKVSLEYLVREKLEKMVQSELDDRLTAYRTEVDQWKANHNSSRQLHSPPPPPLHRHISPLYSDPLPPHSPHPPMESESSDKAGRDGGDGVQGNTALARRCATLAKERTALKTILENKMKLLVDSVASSLASSTASRGDLRPLDTAGRDIAHLQKLLNACIAAINNSNTDIGSPPPLRRSSSSPSPSPPAQQVGVSDVSLPDPLHQRRREQVEALIRHRRVEQHHPAMATTLPPHSLPSRRPVS